MGKIVASTVAEIRKIFIRVSGGNNAPLTRCGLLK
jgi:hypothetical protein